MRAARPSVLFCKSGLAICSIQRQRAGFSQPLTSRQKGAANVQRPNSAVHPAPAPPDLPPRYHAVRVWGRVLHRTYVPPASRNHSPISSKGAFDYLRPPQFGATYIRASATGFRVLHPVCQFFLFDGHLVLQSSELRLSPSCVQMSSTIGIDRGPLTRYSVRPACAPIGA